MSETVTGVAVVDGPSDGELIAAVRAGDVASYGLLFDRHRTAATRLARQLVAGPDADDLVADAFVKVLGVLQRGGGPDEAFRAYLLTAVRRLHIDGIRAVRRTRPTDDEAELDRAVEFVDPSALGFERGAAAQAFASLPERWQLVLWHLDVEGHKPAEIAPLLGLSPNSVSALAYRAREGLRQAYLQQHLAPAQSDGCRAAIGLLGAHVRRGLSARDAAKVETHLDGCARCTGLFLELREVNTHLAGVLGPALLGPAAAGYLGSSSALGAVAGGAALGGGTAVGMAASGQALVLETARVVSVPARAVLGAGAGTAQVAAATVVVVAVAGAGVVATTTDLGGSGPPAPVVATAETTPESDGPPETGTAPSTTPEPAELPGPPGPSATPAATDFGLGPVTSTDEEPYPQRRLRVPVTATTQGTGTDRRLAVRFDVETPAELRAAPAGWSCDAEVGETFLVLICRTVVPAGSAAELTISVAGTRPSGYVTLTGDGDPDNRNDVTRFSSAAWGEAG